MHNNIKELKLQDNFVNIGNKWQDDEIKIMINNIKTIKNIDQIAIIHKRTVSSINNKIYQIGAILISIYNLNENYVFNYYNLENSKIKNFIEKIKKSKNDIIIINIIKELLLTISDNTIDFKNKVSQFSKKYKIKETNIINTIINIINKLTNIYIIDINYILNFYNIKNISILNNLIPIIEKKKITYKYNIDELISNNNEWSNYEIYSLLIELNTKSINDIAIIHKRTTQNINKQISLINKIINNKYNSNINKYINDLLFLSNNINNKENNKDNNINNEENNKENNNEEAEKDNNKENNKNNNEETEEDNKENNNEEVEENNNEEAEEDNKEEKEEAEEDNNEETEEDNNEEAEEDNNEETEEAEKTEEDNNEEAEEAEEDNKEINEENNNLINEENNNLINKDNDNDKENDKEDSEVEDTEEEDTEEEDDEKENDKIKLNEEQEIVYRCFKEKENIFLTGAAGTGKSMTLKKIIGYCKIMGITHGITASTGNAAFLIGGRTLHSYLGIGINKKLSARELFNNARYMYKHIITKLRLLKVLIIDECSMIDCEFFNIISEYLGLVMRNNKPFGGIQILLVGDFCQLEPVSGKYCFESETWNKLNLKIIYLYKLIRQDGDKKFQKILTNLRYGFCSDKIYETLKKYKDTEFTDIKPTILYSKNVDVDNINSTEYNKLIENGALTHVYNIQYPNNNNNNNNKILNWISSLECPTSINLCIGAEIVVIVNIDQNNGIVNGTRGIIVELYDNYITIKLRDNSLYNIHYFKCSSIEDSELFFNYMPIKLAYALTIHKSQGMTLDAIEVDLGNNIFASGQAYTALSRVKNLNNVKINNISKKSFIIKKIVLDFYSKIDKNLI